MSCFVKFFVASAVVFCVADLIPFPNLPPGLIVHLISEHQQQQAQK